LAEFVGDGILQEVERDTEYALGELQDLQDQVDGPLAARLEGIETRLKELTWLLYDYFCESGHNPTHASGEARNRLVDRWADDIVVTRG
jgi:hypothetical protein